MLIFGHKLDTQKEFFWTENFKFKKGINCFFYDEKFIQKAKESGVKFGILVQNEDEVFLANHFEANFILVEDENLARLFDSKILLIVHTLKNLKKAFELGVDGVILKTHIQK